MLNGTICRKSNRLIDEENVFDPYLLQLKNQSKLKTSSTFKNYILGDCCKEYHIMLTSVVINSTQILTKISMNRSNENEFIVKIINELSFLMNAITVTLIKIIAIILIEKCCSFYTFTLLIYMYLPIVNL